jgi:hypothetical protein
VWKESGDFFTLAGAATGVRSYLPFLGYTYKVAATSAARR